MNMDEACKYGIADGIQALKVVRQQRRNGAFLPTGSALWVSRPAPWSPAEPCFSRMPPHVRILPRLIYGGPFGVMPAIPPKLPPIFMAWAQDDDLARDAVVKFYDALKSAGNKPEAHIFSTGGHGFGMRKQGTSSDHWIDEFYYWLEAQGFTRPAAR